MSDLEQRDQWGNPWQAGPTKRPRACPTVGDGAVSWINQPTDNSNNKALPWAVLAALFGGMGFGGVLVLCVLAPWDAADRSLKAEVRAEYAQAVADAQAEARAAGTDAAIWKNRVVTLEAKINGQR